ncbi:DUF488 family protein [bacterium]|nr:DUF488 family protein [bacterium]
MVNKLYTIGYENADIADFIETLKSVGIEKIIDVREYPLSRRKGFSKNVLSALLSKNGISYIHLKGLGDPKPGREAARAGNYKKFRQIFNAHMQTEEACLDLESAITLAVQSTCCLLCYERKPQECHRTIIAAEIAKNTGLDIQAIGVSMGISKQMQSKTHQNDTYHAWN